MKAFSSILLTGLLAAVAGCEQSGEVKVDQLAVVNINPSPGAVGIGRDTDVTVTFSSVLDALTVSPSSMCLNGSDLAAVDLENPCGTGTPVAATVTYDALTLTATLLPGDVLATDTSGGASYSLFLTPQISGQESGALPALVRSTFTTMPE